MAKKSNGTKKGGALKFIASLLFLYVVLTGLNNPTTWGTYIYGSLWAPLLVAAALLGSIVLFFSSLAEMANPEMCMGGKPVMLVAFALVALTVGPLWNAALWITIVGFLIGWAGSAVERM